MTRGSVGVASPVMPPRSPASALTLRWRVPLTSCLRTPPVDFGRDVQPILSENCYKCHGPDAKAREADLRLDTKEGAFRTVDGVTPIKPGDSVNSDVILRVLSDDKDKMMPPPKSHRKLTDLQEQLLKRWVEEGAPWRIGRSLRQAAEGAGHFRFQISDFRFETAIRRARRSAARLRSWRSGRGIDRLLCPGEAAA